MKRPATLGGIVLLGCLAVICGGGFALLHSPFAVNRVGRLFGYDIRADTVALSPSLSGSLSGVTVTRLQDGQVVLAAAGLTAQNSLAMLLKGEIESLELRNPKFTYRLGAADASPSLVSLQNLPNVRLLRIQNAEVQLTFATGPERVHLRRADLTVRNLSSAAGGSIALRTAFTASYGDVTAEGTVTANVELTGLYPRPSGKGSVALAVESGRLAVGGQSIALAGFSLAGDLAYDKATDKFRISGLRGEGPRLGMLTGTVEATLKSDNPWMADLKTTPVEFANLLTVMQPFLPEDYRGWSVQGKGVADLNVKGTYTDRLAFGGTLTLAFDSGGFSSPDGNRAGQGMSGRLVLKLQYATPDTLAFSLDSEERGGEFLWGTYYNNLAGRRMALTAAGRVTTSGAYTVRGALDLFQTGSYTFDLDGSDHEWSAALRVADLSHAKLVEAFVPPDLQSSTPSLQGLSVTGHSSLQASLRHEPGQTEIAGTFQLADTTVHAPGLQLNIQDIAAELPFQLAYPALQAAAPPVPGSIRFHAIQRRRLAIESLTVPVVISQNALEVPQPVVLPFFGGEVHLSDLRLDDVLFPTCFRFAVMIAGVDLGRLTRRMTGIEVPGTINADFGRMEYASGRVASTGRGSINVFGGDVELTNFFVDRIGLPSRTIGGDIVFRNINLRQLTQKITIGSMSGVIHGSLQDFAMQAGQPASFTLTLESADVPGVEQWISVDAIENISILGTGAASPLNTWITAMFKQYPYRKIGIWCRLRNDLFTIRGLIHEGGKEYLVRRALLRGVDVVNQNPDNMISFQDMEERIQRIWSSQPAQPALDVQ